MQVGRTAPGPRPSPPRLLSKQLKGPLSAGSPSLGLLCSDLWSGGRGRDAAVLSLGARRVQEERGARGLVPGVAAGKGPPPCFSASSDALLRGGGRNEALKTAGAGFSWDGPSRCRLCDFHSLFIPLNPPQPRHLGERLCSSLFRHARQPERELPFFPCFPSCSPSFARPTRSWAPG